MELRSGNRKIDEYRPSFDPHLDIATVVFSHVQCVKTRLNLALVSKLWRDASKTAAAYPLDFDFNAFGSGYTDTHGQGFGFRAIGMLDNDEALSLPYERVVGLLQCRGTPDTVNWEKVSHDAASRGSLRLLKWLRKNRCDWSVFTCAYAAQNGHLPALKYSHEDGCPWDRYTCEYAADNKHWDCLQYAVDNKAPGWEYYAKEYAKKCDMREYYAYA
jgi:hypothetical protein